MCGSVRGVGAGGIISTPFCILYKLFTLRLTRKQVMAMIRHKDSPYIRALGFMYIRFTQPFQDLWQWYEPFLDDDEIVDPKAGGGSPMTIGEMVQHFLSKIEWFSILFPRIPRHIKIKIEEKLENYLKENGKQIHRKESDERSHRIDRVSKHRKHSEQDYRHKVSNHNSRSFSSRRSRSRSKSPSSSRYHSKKYRSDEDNHPRKRSNYR